MKSMKVAEHIAVQAPKRTPGRDFFKKGIVVASIAVASVATIIALNSCTTNNYITNVAPTQSDTCKFNTNGLTQVKRDILNVGGVIDAGTFKVRLADISVAVGPNNVHPAIIDIMDANDAVVGQVQVNPCDMYKFTQASTGQSITVAVFETAPGLTLNAKWAEIGIFQ